MFKYVRRRKSTDLPESKPADWDLHKDEDELAVNAPTTDVRHQRWVWLAPLERAVLRSRKQTKPDSAMLNTSSRKYEVSFAMRVTGRLIFSRCCR